MGFKVDHANPIYKRFRLKVLGIFYIYIYILIWFIFLFCYIFYFEVLMNLQMDRFMNDSGLACNVFIFLCVFWKFWCYLCLFMWFFENLGLLSPVETEDL